MTIGPITGPLPASSIPTIFIGVQSEGLFKKIVTSTFIYHKVQQRFMPIQYVGLKKLEEIEIARVKNIAERLAGKLQRALLNDMRLIINLKSHKASGKQKKYSFRLALHAPKRTIEASAFDWDISKALRMAFAALERELEHRFHIDEHRMRFRQSKRL